MVVLFPLDIRIFETTQKNKTDGRAVCNSGINVLVKKLHIAVVKAGQTGMSTAEAESCASGQRGDI
jgi:hypothetical protein